MLNYALHGDGDEVNGEFFEGVDPVLADKQQYSEMDPDVIVPVDALEAVLLEGVVDAAFFNLVEDMDELTQGKLSLDLDCVPIDHLEAERLDHPFPQVHPIGILGQLSDEMDVVFVPLLCLYVADLAV